MPLISTPGMEMLRAASTQTVESAGPVAAICTSPPAVSTSTALPVSLKNKVTAAPASINGRSTLAMKASLPTTPSSGKITNSPLASVTLKISPPVPSPPNPAAILTSLKAITINSPPSTVCRSKAILPSKLKPSSVKVMSSALSDRNGPAGVASSMLSSPTVKVSLTALSMVLKMAVKVPAESVTSGIPSSNETAPLKPPATPSSVISSPPKPSLKDINSVPPTLTVKSISVPAMRVSAASASNSMLKMPFIANNPATSREPSKLAAISPLALKLKSASPVSVTTSTTLADKPVTAKPMVSASMASVKV